MSHVRHYTRHTSMHYASSLSQRIYSALISPFILIVSLTLLYVFLPQSQNFSSVSWSELLSALISTCTRLGIAYILALICALPLAFIADSSPLAERILLPVFDIVQSIPVLVFFPAIIIFFISIGITNGAAIFIIFLNMVWNIVFNIVGGLKIIPTEIKSVAHVFSIKGLSYIRQVLIPSVIPSIITGSLLAWSSGWNMIIVAEVLHTYIPQGTERDDLFGIGSILVHASVQGKEPIFIASLVFIIFTIAFLNLTVWQNLLKWSERYRFE